MICKTDAGAGPFYLQGEFAEASQARVEQSTSGAMRNKLREQASYMQEGLSDTLDRISLFALQLQPRFT
jgi:hypothetical protein